MSLTAALQLVEASAATAMSYLTVVWGLILGYFFFSEVTSAFLFEITMPCALTERCDISCSFIGFEDMSCDSGLLILVHVLLVVCFNCK